MTRQILITEKVRQCKYMFMEDPEQLLNELKSKWLVEMAAKNLSAIF